MAVSSLVFHLTDRCQLDCRHCLRDPDKAPTDLSLEVLDRAIAQARRDYACSHVGLTGGEPTLHPRLDAVLDTIVRHDVSWHLVTSGRRFDTLLTTLDDVPARRERLQMIDLSLEAATEERHDAIRGAGSFRDVMTAATLCKARAIPFTLQMTINALNADQIEQVGVAAAHLGAKTVTFGPTVATGTDHDRELQLSLAQWRTVRDRLDRLADTLKICVNIAYGFFDEHPFQTCPAKGGDILHVDAAGRLTVCCQLSDVPGGEADIVADLATTDLTQAHAQLLEIVHRTQQDKLVAIRNRELSGWDLMPCNHCAKSFGKPHWIADDTDSIGPRAVRARWTKKP